ncbi:protein MpAPX4 [Marchantia polymorpha subsp. ruderalis]|uniref:Plant heme peroxidase family profile domain-containing protein n=2 Tax=Marchantia polymorpha TaxID=3197 RepID=A0AAF6APD5_MARPO|nr:hypothetical protein MARPO_0019s0014 [Marchantia polymorpha]BBM98305.1 hypothetical protein Mp_1g12440 [Marchantia polymorpha subsp. ruderalis]|eukprot:PTQ44572.1 hypothetical protein MARPO_0019s0014 [Marchantia polymorpha]
MALCSKVHSCAALPSLGCPVPLPASSAGAGVRGARTSARRVVGVRAQNDGHEQERERKAAAGVDRREALALGLALGASALLPANADAADLTQRFQRGEFLASVKEKLRVAVKDNQALVPDLMRLALNDALTFDKETKTGGSNGSILFELERPENRGLEAAVALLAGVKKDIDAASKGGPISWADLIQLGAQSATKRTFIDAAIRKCGGKEDKGLQLYQAYGSSGQWGQFDKLLGRSSASEADPSGRVLLWQDASAQEIKDRFAQLGIKPRQIAVLSAFLGPNQADIEAKLVADPDFTPWVKKYQISRETVSQTDYEVDLITSFTKLSVLGQTINYEAYSYVVPRKPLRF